MNIPTIVIPRVFTGTINQNGEVTLDNDTNFESMETIDETEFRGGCCDDPREELFKREYLGKPYIFKKEDGEIHNVKRSEVH